MLQNKHWPLIGLLLFLLLSAAANVYFAGSSNVWGTDNADYILYNLRLPKTVTCVLVGMGLSTCGLLLQTFFKNPLAGPSVLGINSGAALGTAIVILFSEHIYLGYLWENIGFNYGVLVVSALAGALLVMAVIYTLSLTVKNQAILVIAGLMVGNIALAIVGVLQYYSQPEDLKNYVLWTFGSVSGLGMDQVGIMALIIIPVFLACVALSKQLDFMLLDSRTASAMGFKPKKMSRRVLLLSSILAAICTAFCGPIGFVGIAVPYLSRILFSKALHFKLLIANALLGGSLILWADVLCHGIAGFRLPLNVVMALFGSPVVLLILFRYRKTKSLG